MQTLHIYHLEGIAFKVGAYCHCDNAEIITCELFIVFQMPSHQVVSLYRVRHHLVNMVGLD